MGDGIGFVLGFWICICCCFWGLCVYLVCFLSGCLSVPEIMFQGIKEDLIDCHVNFLLSVWIWFHRQVSKVFTVVSK